MRSRCVLLLAVAVVSAEAAIEFNRDVRPILSDKCYSCHGPDSVNRKADLRLDVEAAAKARKAIVPGKPEESLALQRITHTNKGLRMPPLYASANGLSDRETAVLRQWIAEGAVWQKHWSLIPPQRPTLPQVSDASWPKNGIDHFILSRLDREGLKPSPEASKPTLLRRLSLDLTGLPPTPKELDEFLADTSPKAYENAVDRLLASERFGERMAARWLDAARYADTNGYQTDAERFMWRWRDWVIDAFNKNMPFNRFTIEQLAGDLLPNPTLDQLIATGFNRNHRGNGEGGSIGAEFLVEYHVDRVETTSTVWMGLTLGCTRCHDHKYDPFSQKEFYQLVAFFNNLNEKGKVFKYGNSPPLIPAPTKSQQEELAALEAKLKSAEDAFAALAPARQKQQKAWEKSLAGDADWYPHRSLLAQYRLDGSALGADRSGKELKAAMKDGDEAYEKGPLGQSAAFDGKRYVDAGPMAPFGFYSKFSLAAWVKPAAKDGAIITRSIDKEEGSGWGLYIKDGKLQVNLVLRWLDDCLRVETVEPIALNQWQHVAMSYDATRVADGIKVYVNGKSVKLNYIVDDLNQSFQTKEPMRIGAGNGLRFQGGIDDVRVYNDVITPREAAVLAETGTLAALARVPAAKRTQAQADKLEWAFLEQYSPDEIRSAWARVNDLRHERVKFLDNLPTTMIMQEMETPRQAHLLIRGAYDRPGEPVSRMLPAALPPLPQGAPVNRLGFAQWLVSPEHPLTARVTVNRFWQMMFGTGIVKTVEDFGSQGEWPVHPELLDWMATEFMRTGWDMKGILKTMVMSAAYRQSSRATPDMMQRDPDNRLLARGPRYRLPAEVVRDQALSMSGLLVEKLGGPSVKPYQPAGLWKELAGGTDYQRDSGEKLYRRSLYTYWKRAVPPPGMMTFDSAGREACTVRENRTNTPLQALTLMNDETYLEAARKIAERMLREGGPTPAARLDYGYRLAMARAPRERERTVLLASLNHHLDRYKTNPAAAEKFLEPGESEIVAGLDRPELAAYATVASMILNLDETVTKE